MVVLNHIREESFQSPIMGEGIDIESSVKQYNVPI